MREPLIQPLRVLITLDAVGGVWNYALDVARGLEPYGVTCLLVGFGPEPAAAQRAEREALANTEVVWTGESLDWMVSGATALRSGARRLAALGRSWGADLLHLNLPSQAAELNSDLPVIVTSHSCVPTWWEAVRGSELPSSWSWLHELNRAGFRRANAVLVPSESHGAALRRVYGAMPPLHVVHNATSVLSPVSKTRQPLILAVGRWWDEGKNGAVLDAAAASAPWPILLAGPLLGPNGQQAAFRKAETLGALSHGDVQGLMRRATIFAAPSLYEPFGLAVVEAAINGAALVLADIPTFRELWDGAAMFAHPDDADGWARTFSTIAADSVLGRWLASQAASRASRFTMQRQAARLHEFYSSLGAGQ